MSTATQKDEGADVKSADKKSRHAILFELEGIAGSGRQATFDVLSSILGEQGIKISAAHISRFCLGMSPDHYMEPLLEALGASRQSADRLSEDVKSGIAMHLSSKAKAPTKTVVALLKSAADRGLPIAAVTSLPKATAEALMENLGFNAIGVQLFVVDPHGDDHFPRADSWLKVAKSLGKSPFDCGVIASTHDASKSALSAGMRCVAIPDGFTSFQDFGGANGVVDDVASADAEEILLDLCPHVNE